MLICRCITDDSDTYRCPVSSDPFFSVIRGEITCNTLRCRCITDDPDTLPCVVPSDYFLLVIHRGEVTWNTFCTPCASHYSKSTPSRPYHTLETKKGGSAVESTSYNNGWPGDISGTYASWKCFLWCFGHVRSQRTHIHGFNPKQLLAYIPDPTP